MHSRLMLGTLALTSCIRIQTFVIAPRPVVGSDSAARVAFATSAMALLEQTAKEDSLTPTEQKQDWTACFRSPDSWFRVCGRMDDSVMRIQFRQGGPGGTFWKKGYAVQRDFIARLQGAFGENRVRQCSFNWRGDEKCPPLAQLDSGEQASAKK